MRNIRAYHQVPNKKGNFPSLLGVIGGTNITVCLRVKDGKIDVQPIKERDREIVSSLFHNKLTNGDFSPLLFPVEINPPQKEMSRFLAKMALEALAHRFLNEPSCLARIIDEPYYDPIRKFARYGAPSIQWPFHQRRIYPIETNMHHPKTDKWVQAGFGYDLLLTSFPETYFVFIFYGMEFVINIGGPSIKGYENWLIENNNISPVIERIGLKLVSKIENGKPNFFLE